MAKSVKKIIPNIKPTTAGIQEIIPWLVAISREGINKDQTEAATITPEAKPSNDFSTLLLILFFIKKTTAAPNKVPIKGIVIPRKRLILSHP